MSLTEACPPPCARLVPVPARALPVDHDAALDWIDANQLGRRNLSPDACHRMPSNCCSGGGIIGRRNPRPKPEQSADQAKVKLTLAYRTQPTSSPRSTAYPPPPSRVRGPERCLGLPPRRRQQPRHGSRMPAATPARRGDATGRRHGGADRLQGGGGLERGACRCVARAVANYVPPVCPLGVCAPGARKNLANLLKYGADARD